MKQNNLLTINCHLCGSKDYRVLFPSSLTQKDFNHKKITSELKNTLGDYKKHSRIVKCLNCSLIYTNPMENPKLLLAGYKDVVDKEYLRTEKYRKILLQKHLDNIEQFKQKGRILEIGCFAGYFLELAKERGWETYGIEPSTWARNLAKKRKAKIVGTDIEKTKLQKNFFDVITMWDVIEHLDNPKKIITKCHDALKKGGILALGTPDYESLVAKLMGSNYPYLVRMHHIMYSPKTLKQLVEGNGFIQVKKYSYGRTFPVSYIVDRIKTKNNLYQSAKKIINSSKIISSIQIHINIGDSFVIIAKK